MTLKQIDMQFKSINQSTQINFSSSHLALLNLARDQKYEAPSKVT